MSESNHLPRVAITLGDAAGIGPEVVVRACLEQDVRACCRPFVVGHPEVLRREVQALGAPLEVREVTSPRDIAAALESDWARGDSASLVCLKCCDDAVVDVPPGRVDPRAGRAAYDALCTAAELALRGTAEAIVTAPLSKAALHLAGLDYPGHTEILAELCRTKQFAMMLYLPPECLSEKGDRHPAGAQWSEKGSEKGDRHPAGASPPFRGGLAVVHATLHVAVRDAISQLTTGRILDCCHLAQEGIQRLGVAAPRIGVCALNPHGGEGGLFGDEELTLIMPAVEQARAAGLAVTGPLPADALFVKARRGEFDAVVAMYHDQGHIPLKLLGMHRAVNVTLGLPIIRTSPAHGTAFDIAGRQQAECSGMVSAIEAAARLVARDQRSEVRSQKSEARSQ